MEDETIASSSARDTGLATLRSIPNAVHNSGTPLETEFVPDTEDPVGLTWTQSPCKPSANSDAISNQGSADQDIREEAKQTIRERAEHADVNGDCFPEFWETQNVSEQAPKQIVANESHRNNDTDGTTKDANKNEGSPKLLAERTSQIETLEAKPQAQAEAEQNDDDDDDYFEETEMPEFIEEDLTQEPITHQSQDHQADVSQNDEEFEETEMPEFIEEDILEASNAANRPQVLTPEDEEFPEQSEMPEFIEEDVTQLPGPAPAADYDSEIEAEIDEFIEDDVSLCTTLLSSCILDWITSTGSLHWGLYQTAACNLINLHLPGTACTVNSPVAANEHLVQSLEFIDYQSLLSGLFSFISVLDVCPERLAQFNASGFRFHLVSQTQSAQAV